MAEAPEAPCTPLCSLYPGGGLVYWPPPKNLPALKAHISAKFHRNPSSGLDLYSKQTHTQPNIALYVLDLV